MPAASHSAIRRIRCLLRQGSGFAALALLGPCALAQVSDLDPVQLASSGTTAMRLPRVSLTAVPGVAGFNTPPAAGDMAVLLSHTTDGNRQFDVTAWHRATPAFDAFTPNPPSQPTFGARVEMQLPASRAPGFAADYGFIGLQIQGGARIMLRKSEGRPTIVYRIKF